MEMERMPSSSRASSNGSLAVVGVGIKFVSHTTLEARSRIEVAEEVLFAVADPATATWILTLNTKATPFPHYAPGQPRRKTYNAWVERMLTRLREGISLCAVFYGHPGVFVYPAHEAIRRARQEGYPAVMLPGVSAADCLYADLGVDPAENGCQSFDATDFLIYQRSVDLCTPLLLWQIGVAGYTGYAEGRCNPTGIRILTDYLCEHYGGNHQVVVYEAARYAFLEPQVQQVMLRDLPGARITMCSILYIPPLQAPILNLEMAARLGLHLPHPLPPDLP
jgi:precorrin-6B methylase 1